jgi:hypothetical protein
MLHKGNALYVFHNEERGSVGRSVSVIQTCNGGMIQLRECALFDGESFTSRGGKPSVAKHLNGNPGLKILALRKIDDAHPTMTQNPLSR